MTAADVGGLSKAEVLALRGLRLPALALKGLRQAGIHCDPSVSIQHQGHAQSYVIRGVESGGAVQEMGLYCSFVRTDGSPLTWLQKVQSVGRNGLHAVVIAPELLRVQIFRNQQTYQLLITQHHLETVQGSRRPALLNNIVFHGINGTLDQNVDHMESAGSPQMPVFRTRSGELLPVSRELQWVLARLTVAVSCVGCKHCHLLEADQKVVVESLPVVSL
jgi:hypothetical protein